MTAPNPRGAAPGIVMDVANVFAADLGAPVVADVDRFVTSVDMANGAYTLAQTTHADGLARNVTVTVTAGDTADTMGTVLVEGTNLENVAISETITPVAGSTVAGAKAFKTVTGVTGAGWAVDGAEATADNIEVGTGNLIGLPASVFRTKPITAAAQVFAVLLGGAIVAPTITWDADELEKNTVDASAGTYNGTKRLVALVRR